jgi:hypothetical protein
MYKLVIWLANNTYETVYEDNKPTENVIDYWEEHFRTYDHTHHKRKAVVVNILKLAE